MGYFLLYILLGLHLAPPIDAWCDVVFKDVVREADVVLVTQARKQKGAAAELAVLDVLKGEYAESAMQVDEAVLEEYGIRPNDHVLLALGKDGQLVASSQGLGACFPISLLRLRGDKLRGRDRVNYDSRREPMRLDELRQDLSLQLR